MKVLITVSTYFPKKDGVSNVTTYLAEGLSKLGHQVTVITSNKGNLLDNEIHNKVNIKRVNLYTKYGLYFGNKKEYKNLILDEANKCDVMINVCTQNAFTDLILNDLDKYKCKKVLYLHGIFDFKFNACHFYNISSLLNKLWKEIRWFIYYKVNGKNFKKYNKVINLHEKEYATKYFKNKYNINANIIETACYNVFFDNIFINDFAKPFNKYLLLVANYDQRKNQKLAIKEFLNSNIDSDIGLVLIGSTKNKYYKMLEKYIVKRKKKLGLKESEKPIKMLYNIDRKYMPEYYKNSYLTLITSVIEMFPMTIVESVASGVPYISTDVGIVKYLKCGYVSKKNEIHSYIEKLVNDEELRSSISNECLSYRENFRIEDKVNKLNDLIK